MLTAVMGLQLVVQVQKKQMHKIQNKKKGGTPHGGGGKEACVWGRNGTSLMMRVQASQ
jgi:hypothetical protein